MYRPEVTEFFPGHDCQTARYAGFGGLKNGELLAAAEAHKFDVLLTVDRGMEYEQDVHRQNIAVIVLCTKSIRLKDLLPLAEDCLARLESVEPGQIIRISG